MACHQTHVSAGALAGAAVAAVAQMPPTPMALFVLCSAGAALLPDLDHPNAAATNAAGPVLSPVLFVFRHLMIKHRGVTHTLLAALVATLGIYMLRLVATANPNAWDYEWPLRMLVPAVLAALAARSLMTIGDSKGRDRDQREYRALVSKKTRRIVCVLVGLAATVIGSQLGHQSASLPLWLAMAFGVGYASHLITDAFMNGVPLLWIPLVGRVLPMCSLDRRITLGKIKTDEHADHSLGYIFFVLTIVIVAGSIYASTDLTSVAHHLHT